MSPRLPSSEDFTDALDMGVYLAQTVSQKDI